MMGPLISILLPVYNGENFLSEAIQSVITQTYKNWELIIINDGSTDNTERIIEQAKLEETRIISFKNTHSGVAKSLNFGLKKISGEFIARIDSDDLWLPHKLETQFLIFRENKKLHLLGTSVLLIDENGIPLPDQRGFNNKKRLSYKHLKFRLIKNNLFCHSSVMFRKDLIAKIGTYNINFKNSEDYELWIRAAKKLVCEISDQVLVHYRIWPGTVSLKRREEQILFSLKARMSGLFTLGNPFLNLIYLIRFIANSLIFLIRRKIYKGKS